MKKGIAVITAVIVIGMSGLVSAQMNDKSSGMMDKGDKGGMMGGSMMGKGMMGKGMMGMMKHGMMMKMMEKSVVATSDGGVVIVVGNKVSKFDKDLNLVKEVDLKTDMDGMKKMMGEMMEQCSMMDKGMKGKGMDMDGDDDDKPAAAAAAPSTEVDHTSHHQ